MTLDPKALADALKAENDLIDAALRAYVPAPPPPPYDPQVKWRMALTSAVVKPPFDDLNNSGAANSVGVQCSAEGIPLSPRGNAWVMKQSVAGTGGTRAQTYNVTDPLCRAGTPFWYSWYSYFPAPISFSIYDMYMLAGLNSIDPNAGGAAVPVWCLYLSNAGMKPLLIWSPNDMAPEPGPFATSAPGKKAFSAAAVVPVGAWPFFEIYVKPAADYTGELAIYMNKQLLWGFAGVRTMYPLQPAGLSGFIDKDAYGSNLSPNPCVQYCDDLTISLGRMP